MTKKTCVELTLKYDRSFEVVTEFMNVAMDVKRIKLYSSLAKHLPIAEPSLGHQSLA